MCPTVSMYPDPFTGDQWNTSAHPLFLRIAHSLQGNDWNVMGIKLRDLIQPDNLEEYGVQILHMNWTESLTDFFITKGKNTYFSRILQSKYNLILPKKRIIDRGKRKIDDWISAIRNENIPIVFEIHELSSHGFQTNPVLFPLDQYLKEQIFQVSKGIIVHESSCLPYIYEQYGMEKPYVVAPLGDYSEFHGPPLEKDTARETLGLKNCGKILAYIGTARPNRNPTKIIKEFSRFARDYDRLIIAGQGMDKYTDRRDDPKIILYPGLLTNEMIRDIICASDFIVNDAQKYMTSAIIRAAMSYGIPVIAYPYGASHDMAEGAAIFIRDDDSGLGDAIINALKMSPQEYNAMVRSAMERNAERTWEKTGVALASFYEMIVRRNEEKNSPISFDCNKK